LMGLPRRIWLVCAVAGLTAIGLYLYHYASPPHHSSPAESLRHPLAILDYVAKYLGVALPPWTRLRDPIAVCTGGFGLLAALAVLWFVVRWSRKSTIFIALLGIMLFSIATGFITALGRIGFGTDQAFQSRYQTYNLLFWFALLSLLLLIINEKFPFLRTMMLLMIPVVMIPSILLLFPLCLRAAQLIIRRSEAAAVALQVRVPDTKMLVLLNPDPVISWTDAEYFKDKKLSIFFGPRSRELYQPLVSAYELENNSYCVGQVNSVQEVPAAELLDSGSSGVRLTGSAIDLPSGDAARELLVAAHGVIVGFGVGGLQSRTSGDKSFLMKRKFVEWSGLARVPPDTTFLEVYAVDNHRRTRVCPLTIVHLEKR
jgi:hypothetical protein